MSPHMCVPACAACVLIDTAVSSKPGIASGAYAVCVASTLPDLLQRGTSVLCIVLGGVCGGVHLVDFCVLEVVLSSG